MALRPWLASGTEMTWPFGGWVSPAPTCSSSSFPTSCSEPELHCTRTRVYCLAQPSMSGDSACPSVSESQGLLSLSPRVYLPALSSPPWEALGLANAALLTEMACDSFTPALVVRPTGSHLPGTHRSDVFSLFINLILSLPPRQPRRIHGRPSSQEPWGPKSINHQDWAVPPCLPSRGMSSS